MDMAVLLTAFLTKVLNALGLLQSARTVAMPSSKGLNPAIMVEKKDAALDALPILAMFALVLLQNVNMYQSVTMEF